MGFGEHVVHTGPLFMTAAATVDYGALPDQPVAGQEVTAAFEILGDGWFHAQRGVPADAQPSPAALPSPRRSRVSYRPIATPTRMVQQQ